MFGQGGEVVKIRSLLSLSLAARRFAHKKREVMYILETQTLSHTDTEGKLFLYPLPEVQRPAVLSP